jgi:hypothetical protein
MLNGTSDFYACRIMNFANRLDVDKSFYEKTRGIWSPKRGKYKGRELDLGFVDYFTNITSKATEGWLSGKGVDKDQGGVVSLEKAKVGEENFWEDLARGDHNPEKAAVPPMEYVADQIDKFARADATRSALWEADSFFHNPTLAGFLELRKVFKHIARGKRQEKWEEMLVRTVEWMGTREGKELLEEAKIFPASERFIWIDQASDYEMITNEQRDRLLNKHVIPFGVGRFIPLPAREKAQLWSTVDTLWGIGVRYAPIRNEIAFGAFKEYVKRAFTYVFSDDLR